MSIDNAIASLPVKNLSTAVVWYEALLGRAADSTPMPGLAEWRFPRGGWLQVVQLPERAGNGTATLAVTHLDEVVAHVKQLGIDTSRTTSSPKARTLMVSDLDGNQIAFAEALEPTMAH